LLFIAVVFTVVSVAHKAFIVRHPAIAARFRWAWRIPPYVIGSIAMFWVIQRVSVF
jgi:hypothetical protein